MGDLSHKSYSGPRLEFRWKRKKANVNTNKAIRALEKHAKEEWRIHQELLKNASVDVRRLARKHWKDTRAIHRDFLKDLKRAWKAPQS
jgi:hypothetical protein